jgi:hypothetical protein
MFGNSTAFESLFDELRRVERGLDQMYGRHSGPGRNTISGARYLPSNQRGDHAGRSTRVPLRARPGRRELQYFSSAKPSPRLWRQEASDQ